MGASADPLGARRRTAHPLGAHPRSRPGLACHPRWTCSAHGTSTTLQGLTAGSSGCLTFRLRVSGCEDPVMADDVVEFERAVAVGRHPIDDAPVRELLGGVKLGA